MLAFIDIPALIVAPLSRADLQSPIQSSVALTNSTPFLEKPSFYNSCGSIYLSTSGSILVSAIGMCDPEMLGDRKRVAV